jgi:hypothetical protein
MEWCRFSAKFKRHATLRTGGRFGGVHFRTHGTEVVPFSGLYWFRCDLWYREKKFIGILPEFNEAILAAEIVFFSVMLMAVWRRFGIHIHIANGIFHYCSSVFGIRYCIDSVGLDAEMIRKYVVHQERKEREKRT